jgi:hypothetical protein
MTITSLTEHKSKKKYKKVVEDIDGILKVISLSQKSLSFFKQYLPVQEMISVLETNKTLLELHRKKYEGKLEELEKKYSQQSEK